MHDHIRSVSTLYYGKQKGRVSAFETQHYPVDTESFRLPKFVESDEDVEESHETSPCVDPRFPLEG